MRTSTFKICVRLTFLSLITGVLFSCGEVKNTQENEVVKADLEFKERLVLPGDFADPSIIRVGDEYWATATSSQWAPLYPILRSTNLTDWEIVTHVFPDSLPEWADSHFWAPELKEENGKYYVYYTARETGASLCVGVATADHPAGPYTDLGPIVCQEAGAIDGEHFRDEDGILYLIWKEDGNSRGEPTPLWAQEMNEERTELLGERFELFRNDPNTWEGNLVEGAYLVKEGEYYYTFYSGDACCGRGCTYGVGVARAKSIKGPWEKYGNNPIKKETEDWKCAGHGSMVQTEDGRYFFLYHAYNQEGSVYTGRQGLIDEIVWDDNGWPKFKDGEPDKVENSQLDLDIKDDFAGEVLSASWQWPIGNWPEVELNDGKLVLHASSDKMGAVVGQRTLSANYEAEVILDLGDSEEQVQAGLTAIGDENNAIGISHENGEILLWKRQRGEEEVLQREALSDNRGELVLKVQVRNGDEYAFSWMSADEVWNDFEGQNLQDGEFLPPWDRAVRIGIFSRGNSGTKAVFDSFNVRDITGKQEINHRP